VYDSELTRLQIDDNVTEGVATHSRRIAGVSEKQKTWSLP